MKQGATKASIKRKNFMKPSECLTLELISYLVRSKKNQPVIATTKMALSGIRMLQQRKSIASKMFLSMIL